MVPPLCDSNGHRDTPRQSSDGPGRALPFPVVNEEHDREELEEGRCPSCGEELAEEEAGQPVCGRCDERLERELTAYLDFLAACRESA